MQIRHSLVWLTMAFFSSELFSQTTYLPLWGKESLLFERMEIKAQSNNDLNLSAVKPYMRKTYVQVADSIRVLLLKKENPLSLSAVDRYNLNSFQAGNADYSTIKDPKVLKSWKTESNFGPLFYNKANAYVLKKPGFVLVANPAITMQQTKESNNDEQVFFRAFGVTGRGMVANKIGFQFHATANSESGPLPFRDFVKRNNAVPGAVRFNHKEGTPSYTYADLRGSINWGVTKYINMQVGRDQQFIGNGYRSLYLSNFSGPHTFFKINTRIWKLNYTNLYTQFAATPDKELNKQFKKKYSSMHHLSINATKWLNVGVFEAVVFGRENHYDYSYLLPVIFLRSIEHQNGSPDNANVGFDFKANILKRLQVYGVLMLDEFKVSEIIGESRYWWGNKQGYQVGAKYIDAFGVGNLDLQAEFNQIRPFMYQYRDTTGAYTHALQPLAHPMGANLREVIGVARYQPIERLVLSTRINVWKQGLDSFGYNFGSNPNTLYTSVTAGGSRPRNDNFPMFSGLPATGLNGLVSASYEAAQNLFFETSFGFRSYLETDKPRVNTSLFTIGFRWNMYRKDYDY